MKINPRELKYKIEIKRLKKSESVLEDDKYVIVRTCKAKVKMLGGNEFLKADAMNVKQTANFIIRGSSKYIPLNTDIIVFRDREYSVEYINDLPDIGRNFIELKGVLV